MRFCILLCCCWLFDAPKGTGDMAKPLRPMDDADTDDDDADADDTDDG